MSHTANAKPAAQMLLDTLEPKFTRPSRYSRDNPRPWLLAFVYPLKDLQPTEEYTWRLFFRQVTPSGVAVVLLLALTQVVVWGCLWHQFPFLFTDRRNHKILISLLSEGVYPLPWVFLLVLAFNYALHLPERYFWNRRAARLRREPRQPATAPIADVAADPTVWPPPPKTVAL